MVNTTNLEGILAASSKTPTTAPKTIATMTQAEIDAATAKVVASGGKSTDRANQLPGESSAEANARIAAGYKEMLAKPVLSQEQIDAGATVKFVQIGKGGVGEYTVVKPIGYSGPTTTTEWTSGIIPATGKYTSGTTLGVMSDGKGGYTAVTGAPVTSSSGTGVPGGNAGGNAGGNVGGNTGGNTGGSTSAPVGTPPAYVYNSKTGKWEMPPKPSSPGSWVWDNVKGWVNTTVNPGASGSTTEGGPTLAINTFKNTLSLFFGASEMSQTWVDTLYKHVASFYNTGSTIDEALNLALQDVRNNPVMAPFTKRFSGIYALQDRLAKGEAITVPTIAEYFKTESAMGDVLRSVGLGELATQDFLGNVLGLGKSLTEVTNLIDKTFTAIDNAPAALKADLQTYFPGVDRTSLAKALLTGKEGWAELDRKVRGISVLSAAKTQGINVDLAQATNVADMGYDYAGALTGFQKVKELERGQMLGKISNIDLTQEDAIAATFQSNAKALSDIEKIKGIEAGRFSGTSGRLPSRMRGQGLF